MSLSRISWIDIARGIGIILVIHGHSLSADSYRHLIYAFHMPLFFFISGLVFNYTRNDKLGRVIKKSAKGILIPYVGFAILSYFFWWIQNANLRFDLFSSLNHLSGIIYGNSSNLFFNVVLWFLPCLFITKVGFAFIAKYVKKEQLIIASLVILSIVGYVISVTFNNLKLPFGAETALTAIVFFGAGSLLITKAHQRVDSFIDKRKVSLFAFSSIFCAAIAVINFSIYGYQVDMRLNNLTNYFLFYFGSFSGILATVAISKMINRNYALEVVGKYSLALFALHPIALFYINNAVAIVISGNTLNAFRDIYFSPIFTTVAIGVILLISYIWKKTKPIYARR